MYLLQHLMKKGVEKLRFWIPKSLPIISLNAINDYIVQLLLDTHTKLGYKTDINVYSMRIPQSQNSCKNRVLQIINNKAIKFLAQMLQKLQ